jgi:hypothetical protein
MPDPEFSDLKTISACFRAVHDRAAAARIFLTKIPRKPLKSLVSDERIQGNPRNSNP